MPASSGGYTMNTPYVVNYQYAPQQYTYGYPYAQQQQQQSQSQYQSQQPSSYYSQPTYYNQPTNYSGSSQAIPGTPSNFLNYYNQENNGLVYPYSSSRPTGNTDAFGNQLCYWSDYPEYAPCGQDPQQWIYDPYTGTWY